MRWVGPDVGIESQVSTPGLAAKCLEYRRLLNPGRFLAHHGMRRTTFFTATGKKPPFLSSVQQDFN